MPHPRLQGDLSDLNSLNIIIMGLLWHSAT